MDRVEIPTTIKVMMATQRCLGLWDIEDARGNRGRIVKILHFSFFVSFVISLGAGAFTSKDYMDCVYLTVIAVASGVHGVRLFYIMCRKSEILEFVTQDGPLVIEDHEDTQSRIQANNKVQKLMKFIQMIYIVTAIAIILGFSTCAVENALPFNISFPLDYKNSSIGFWMAFAYIVVHVIYGLAILGLTVTLWYLMLIFGIKYELLGNQLRRIGTEKSSTKTRKLTEAEQQFMFYQDLTPAITSHLNIREKIDQFHSTFSKLFFIQLTTSSMTICGIVYVLAFNYRQDIFMTVFYIFCLGYCLFDIFMFMYLGDEIKSSSDKLSYCLFESNWLEQSQSSKKCIIILGEMLRQPHELVIGIIYPLNLETFRRILNLAYNLFNILQNLN